jgi:hypothetical protein
LDEIAPGIRVRYLRSEPPPPYTYAVTVEVEVGEDRWVTVRLWDNADDVNEHHMHRYTQQEGKQSPEILNFNSVNEAMAAAKKESAGGMDGDRETMAAVMSRKGDNDTASRRMGALFTSPELDTYPSPLHLVAADNPRHDEMATRALLDGDSVLIVYPDGHELLIQPEPSGGAHLETRRPSDQSIAA